MDCWYRIGRSRWLPLLEKYRLCEWRLRYKEDGIE